MNICFLAEAKSEILEASSYYELQANGLGQDFLNCIEDSLDILKDDPLRYPIVRNNVRRTLVKRFPFCLLYQVDGNEILILAVMHLRKHPTYWTKRI
jgi:hypothetical protein